MVVTLIQLPYNNLLGNQMETFTQNEQNTRTEFQLVDYEIFIFHVIIDQLTNLKMCLKASKLDEQNNYSDYDHLFTV